MTTPAMARDHVSVESEVLRIIGVLRRSFDFLERSKASGGTAELHINLYPRGDFQLELLPGSLALLGRLGLALALEGEGVLNDPLGLTIEDDSSKGEPRWVTVSASGELLAAVWCLHFSRVSSATRQFFAAKQATPGRQRYGLHHAFFCQRIGTLGATRYERFGYRGRAVFCL